MSQSVGFNQEKAKHQTFCKVTNIADFITKLVQHQPEQWLTQKCFHVKESVFLWGLSSSTKCLFEEHWACRDLITVAPKQCHLYLCVSGSFLRDLDFRKTNRWRKSLLILQVILTTRAVIDPKIFLVRFFFIFIYHVAFRRALNL